MTELDKELARNEALWAAWTAHGVTAATTLTVDYFFYVRGAKRARELGAALEVMGLSVDLRPPRFLLAWLVSWSVEAHETAVGWSLEELQERSRRFVALASRLGADYDGCGATMP
jgi:hypothetical protein